jgi:branched-subunit amino acid aminotransferase/4-amino-4-deoxychorismate lyase
MTRADLIWMDGELVPWDDANVHVLTHALHYGTGVYEDSAPTTRRAARPSSGTAITSIACSAPPRCT